MGVSVGIMGDMGVMGVPVGTMGNMGVVGSHGESWVMVSKQEPPDCRHKHLWLPSNQPRRFPSVHLSDGRW